MAASQVASLASLEHGMAFWFRDWPNYDVPAACAGVYTVWNGASLLYAGMSGRGLTEESIALHRTRGLGRTGLFKRLRSHSRGRRSGDQFCVYVADRYVLPRLTRGDVAAIAAGKRKFDALVRAYIHEHLTYRFVEVPDGVAAFALEAAVRSGALSAGKPDLNPA
jgi:hypothetical protein